MQSLAVLLLVQRSTGSFAQAGAVAAAGALAEHASPPAVFAAAAGASVAVAAWTLARRRTFG